MNNYIEKAIWVINQVQAKWLRSFLVSDSLFQRPVHTSVQSVHQTVSTATTDSKFRVYRYWTRRKRSKHTRTKQNKEKFKERKEKRKSNRNKNDRRKEEHDSSFHLQASRIKQRILQPLIDF